MMMERNRKTLLLTYFLGIKALQNIPINKLILRIDKLFRGQVGI